MWVGWLGGWEGEKVGTGRMGKGGLLGGRVKGAGFPKRVISAPAWIYLGDGDEVLVLLR